MGSPWEEEMIPQYAVRLLEQMDTSKPFVLIGVSFGGMCDGNCKANKPTENDPYL